MYIEFQVSGAEVITRKLEYSVKQLGNLKPFFKEAFGMIEQNIDKNFKNTATQRFGAWKRLATSTVNARNKRQGYYRRNPNNPNILRWTGALQDNREILISQYGGQLTMTAPHAKYHIKTRPFLNLDRETESLILKNMSAYILSNQKTLE